MKISVVIPTYNRAGRVPDAVRQVLKQDYRPIEVVVVNDGSADNTGDVLAELLAEIGPELVVINKPNGGVSSARNAGLKAATGELIAFLDDDDTWFDGKLTAQAAAMQGADASFTSFERDTGSTIVPMPPTPEQLPQTGQPARFLEGEHGAHINSLMVTADAARKVGDFDEDLKQYEDIEWITRLLCFARVVSLPKAYGRYEYSSGSLFHFVGLESLIKRDASNELMLTRVRGRCQAATCWDDGPWRKRASRDFDQFVKHRLYHGDVKGATEVFERGVAILGAETLHKTRRKLRKAKWLRLIGLKLRHPKFKKGEEVRE